MALLIPVLTVFIVVCTAHYYYTLLYWPAVFDMLNNRWKSAGKAKWLAEFVYGSGAGIGIAAMIYLGLREAIFFLTSAYVSGWFDIGVATAALILAIILVGRFNRIGEALSDS